MDWKHKIQIWRKNIKFVPEREMNEIEVLFHFSSCYKAFNSKNIYQHLPTFNGRKENTKGNVAGDL